MSSALPRSLLEIKFAKAAEAYLRSLPPEHFMEATPQATQREITIESLAVLRTYRPDVQYFNELLVQYRLRGSEDIRQVVPDNLVVLSPEPIKTLGSYDVPLQSVPPFWVLEYVSKSSQRKDYEENFRKYEQELRVPYYLIFYPEAQELTLFHRGRRRYTSVRANPAGRLAIPELELEAALVDGWVRYWYRGRLLPLPAEERQENERLRARLRALGINPDE